MTYHPVYSPHDKMLSLIRDDYKLLQVMSRFGIPLGFGDDTVEKVCKINNVDCDTFLAVVNFLVDKDNFKENDIHLSMESLLHYLRQSHNYFLEFCLPAIRRKILDSINLKDSDVTFLIIKMFDEYVAEIREHMEMEEKTLFHYITKLIEGTATPGTDVETFSENHESVGTKLKELKNIIIRYCPADSKTNLLNAALYDIYRCEEELKGHCLVEDHLLTPYLRKIEAENR